MPKMLWTVEQAREMGKRSAEVRAERKANPPPPPEPIAPPGLAPDPYVALRLARVRRQLDRIDALMMTKGDMQELSWLATAQARVSEQERMLAGRPAPGAFKPTAPTRARRGPSTEGPIGLDPGT